MSISRKRGREETWDWENIFPTHHLRSEDFWESSASSDQFISKSDDKRVIGDGNRWRWKKSPNGWLRVRGDDSDIWENLTAPQPPAKRIKRIRKAGPSMVPAVQPPDHGARSQEREETGEGVLFCY